MYLLMDWRSHFAVTFAYFLLEDSAKQLMRPRVSSSAVSVMASRKLRPEGHSRVLLTDMTTGK